MSKQGNKARKQLDPRTKRWIDNATYEVLLRRWRFAPSGDPMFQGSTGDYYKRVMNRKKSEMVVDEQVQASKNIGW